MEGSGNLPLQIIIIFILILINGFFSASEMAIVSSNKNRINNLAEEGNKKAKILLKLLAEPSNFLATIQVGITLAGFLTAGSAATSLVNKLAPVLTRFNIPYADKIAFILITLLISYFTLVFGELLPKRIALQKPESFALFAAKPINFLSVIAKPFVKLLSGSTILFGKMLGIHSDTIDEQISIEEIRSLIEVGKEKGVINQTERDMLEGIFEFDNKLAREVMTPRPDVQMIDISLSADSILKFVTNSRYSRYPVYENESENIIGILVIKDLYREYLNKGKIEDIRKIMRQAIFVPETKHVDELFKQMQATNNHLAILIDEYGGFSGIVSIEDILEEIVGNIFDEHDLTFQDVKKINNDTYIVNALVSIDQFNDDLNLKLGDENADTIGGYVIEQLGRVPKVGDIVSLKECRLEVLKTSGKRIKELKVTKFTIEEEETDDMIEEE